MVVLIPPLTPAYYKPDLDLREEGGDAPLPEISLSIEPQRPSQRLLRIQLSALEDFLYRLEMRVCALPPGHAAIGIRGRGEGADVQGPR